MIRRDMKNFKNSYQKWVGKMNKLFMLVQANIRKTKSVSATLVIMFIIAALLLNAGLLVVMNYGNHFNKLKEELSPADAYYMLPDTLYNEEVEKYIYENEYINKIENHKGILLDTKIISKGKEQSFNILFSNMDETREISKWKFVGEHLPAEEMSVYVPDIFKAVSGYQLNDKIILNYIDEETNENKTLTFIVKGYIEDIYFSSTDTGFMGFYLTEETYQKVEGIINNPKLNVNVIFANLNEMRNVAEIESGIREILNLNSSSLIAGDISSLFVVIDIELIELSRCMMATMVSVMMVVFAMVIVIVCLLVVRFRIVNSIEDDIVKIGSLKSIGYTSRQIIISLLMQFSLIAGIGSIIGILFSYKLLPSISTVFEQQSGLKWEQGFDLFISSITFFAILLIVAIVAIISARHVNKLSPINALRGEVTARKYKKNYLQLEKAKGNLSIILALKSVLQSIKQNIMIIIIVVSVTFAGVFGVIMYYNTSIDTKAFAEVPGFEICNAIAIFNPEQDHSSAAKIIENMDTVRKVQYLDEVKLKVEGIEVATFVMEDYDKKESILVYEGRYPIEKNEITLAGVLAERLNKKVNDKVTVRFGDKEETFKVVGLSNGSSMGGLNASVLTDDFKRMNPSYIEQSLYIYLDKGTDVNIFIEKLNEQFDKDILLGAMNFDEGLAEGMASYQSIVALMGMAMLIITLLVVTLVLYFVISSSIIRKKRELGIQKAIGFTTFQLMNQISISFTIPIILGAIIGSILGAFYTNPLMSISMKGMGIMKANFIVNQYWIIAFAIITILFSYLLSLLITWRIRKISAYALVTE